MQLEFDTRPIIAHTINKDNSSLVTSSVPTGNFGHYKYICSVDNEQDYWMINNTPLYFYMERHDLNLNRMPRVSDIIREYVNIKLGTHCTKCIYIIYMDHVRYYPVDAHDDTIRMTDDEQTKIRIDFAKFVDQVPIFQEDRFPILSPMFSQRDFFNLVVKKENLIPNENYQHGIHSFDDDVAICLGREELQRRSNLLHYRANLNLSLLPPTSDFLPPTLVRMFGIQQTETIHDPSKDRVLNVSAPQKPLPSSRHQVNNSKQEIDDQTITVDNPFYRMNIVEWSWSLSRMVSQVRTGKLPSIVIRGGWRHGDKSEDRRLYILYLSRIAYMTLYSMYEVSRYALADLFVFPDLSINIPIITLVDLRRFVDFIEENHTRDIRSDVEEPIYENVDQWTMLVREVYSN